MFEKSGAVTEQAIFVERRGWALRKGFPLSRHTNGGCFAHPAPIKVQGDIVIQVLLTEFEVETNTPSV